MNSAIVVETQDDEQPTEKNEVSESTNESVEEVADSSEENEESEATDEQVEEAADSSEENEVSKQSEEQTEEETQQTEIENQRAANYGDFWISVKVLEKYYGDDEVVVIPDFVEVINFNAFKDNTTVKKIIIPSSVEKIRDSAFRGCTSLEYVEIAEGVVDIAGQIFSGCTSLKEVALPDSILDMDNEVFKNCSNLTKVKLPKNLKEIDAYTFSGCKKLESIEIPSGVTSIEEFAFYYCETLKEVKLPAGVDTIGKGAFCQSCNILEMKLPEGVKRIEEGVFAGCDKLKSIEMSDDITYIGKSAFNSCAFESMTLPSKLTYLGEGAFKGCTDMGSIILPDKLESIEPYVFQECKYLNKITIPASVKKIGKYAFEKCYCLGNITIPEGVTEISENAFHLCTRLYTVNLPSTIKTIGKYAFLECRSLININLPSGLEKLEQGCFYYCLNLEKIDIPDTVTVMEDDIFRDCSGLKTLDLPKQIDSVGKRTFLGCKKLWGVTIPASVTTIGDKAFKDCNEDLMLVCDKNSYTEKYAKENNIPYRYTGEKLEQIITVSDVTKYANEGWFWLGALTNGRGTITLESDNPDEIEASGTLVRAVYEAKATITVKASETYHYKEAVTTVTVTVIRHDQNISVETTEYEKMEGDESFNLGATVDSRRELRYSSDNPEVADVDKDGNVTVGKAGKAKITITAPSTCDYYEDKKVVTVNVKEDTNKPGSGEDTDKAENTEDENINNPENTENKDTLNSNKVIQIPEKITLSEDTYVYNGKAKKPKVTVTDTEGKVMEASSYTVVYENNVKVGKATVSVIPKDKSAAGISTEFTIQPKATSIKSVTGKSKSIKIKWAKQRKQTTGYEIQYSTSSKFKKKSTKTVHVSKNNTASKTIKKLKGNKKYYVRIRTYKTVRLKGEKVKIYSEWSAKKAVKVKK